MWMFLTNYVATSVNSVATHSDLAHGAQKRTPDPHTGTEQCQAPTDSTRDLWKQKYVVC